MAAICDASEVRVINKARWRLRWRRTNALLLAACSLLFLAFTTVAGIGVLAHLREHGVPLAQLFVVLSEAQQPSGISPGIVVSGIILGAMFLASALAALAGVCTVLHRSRETKLLLTLWEQHCGSVEKKGSDAHD